MLVFIAFILHWYMSLFFQTIYLHRYASHQMFSMPFWLDRLFYLGTFLAQGASFLDPRVYAVMHMEHHYHSDTKKDPHSPQYFGNVFKMMWHTYSYFVDVQKNIHRYKVNLQGWPLVDKIADSWLTRIIIGFIYFYIYNNYLVDHSWQYLILPLHFIIGPIQGAIVNWCGHKYGYRNYNLPDDSRNTLMIDFLLMGELYQNNHHKFAKNINFAKRWFEIDFGYLSLYPLLKLGLIKAAISK
jgi:stearoyl-CoA desaturase (Delta-9 desaturase)